MPCSEAQTDGAVPSWTLLLLSVPRCIGPYLTCAAEQARFAVCQCLTAAFGLHVIGVRCCVDAGPQQAAQL